MGSTFIASTSHGRTRRGLHRTYFLGLAAGLLGLAGCAEPLPEQPYQPENVLVRFAPDGAQVADRSARARSLAAAGVQPKGDFALLPDWALARIGPGQTVEQAIQALESQPNVLRAEPDYILTTNIVPNDSRFDFLYGLNNAGQTGGAQDADIDAPEAWDVETGGSTVVAVIDTGVDYNHEDLRANFWTNSGEVPNNGRDDDNNGFIDDVRGWDFADNDNDPMDQNNHGTHVAGIIAAAGNNGVGVTGVNWSARIMPLKFMDAQGRGTTSAAIRAIEYAVANGARVSNNSWGGGGASLALRDAIRAAQRADHVFVAAAGNSGVNADRSPHYPSGYDLPNIISVTASDDSDSLASFANFGSTTVDLAAPGVAILSTLPGNRYRSLSGTSMAAPYVAGAAALVLSRNPNLSYSEVRAALLNNVDNVSGLSGLVATGGRLNLFKAVNSVSGGGATPPAAPPPSSTPQPLQLSASSLSLTVGDVQQLGASGGVPPYTWSSGSTGVARVSGTGAVTAVSPGNVSITVVDSVGASDSATVIVNQALSSLQVQAPRSAVLVGDTIAFSVNGGAAPFTWAVDNTAVASINGNGVLTGIAPGMVRVTVVDSNGASDTSGFVEVIARNVQVSSPQSAINVRDTLTLTATGGVGAYTWSVDNAALGSLSAGGGGSATFTAVAAGTVRVTASDSAGNTGSVSIQINDVAPPSSAPGNGALQVDATTDQVAAAQSTSLKVTGGAPPYSWSLTNGSAGAIYPYNSDSSVGWFLANDQSGVTTSIQVTDANGASGQSVTIEVIPRTR